MPNFKATPEDRDLIHRCAIRAHAFGLDWADVAMVLTVANNDVPMDLRALADFPDVDFKHDVFGIHRHLNRETGKIENLFLPRCAK